MSRRPKASGDDRVANRLEHIRDQRGLSRQGLADAVGVHYQTIGYIERGEYSPSLELALRMARLFDVPVEALFALERNDPTSTDAVEDDRRRRSG